MKNSKKIYSKVVMNSRFEVIEEVSSQHDGPVVECKGGSGGGSSSGPVSYPDFMSTWLGGALNNGGADTFTQSITDLINIAIGPGGNPFEGINAYDPVAEVSAIKDAAIELNTFLDQISQDTNWATAFTSAKDIIDGEITDATVNADIVAFSSVLDEELESTNGVIPKFESGMRDIGAVNTSAFVMGRADLYGKKALAVAKYGTELRHKQYLAKLDLYMRGTDKIIEVLMNKSQLKEAATKLIIEANRISIVANKEQLDQDVAYMESSHRWDLEAFQHGANLLASIGSGTAPATEGKKPSVISSALGGALSGAASGALIGAQMGSVGGPMGAGIGAVLGMGASLL